MTEWIPVQDTTHRGACEYIVILQGARMGQSRVMRLGSLCFLIAGQKKKGGGLLPCADLLSNLVLVFLSPVVHQGLED